MKYIFKISFILLVSLFLSIFFLSCGEKATEKRVIVLGIDGMDPNLLQQFTSQGLMPNFARLMREGDFKRLTTSCPPQSPVAWSNFITGMDPGGHGVFDFIHREPRTRIPYLSTSRTEPASKVLKLGEYRIPLNSGKAELLRGGEAFWQILERHKVPSVVFKIPANFPPAETEECTFAGMGAPDILGTYGIFTFFTDDSSLYRENIAGGKVTLVKITEGACKTEILGPYNTLIESEPQSSATLELYIDKDSKAVRILLDDQEAILKPGEWSQWMEVKFQLWKWFAHTQGNVRFYLKQVAPHFELYCSPVNLSPEKPALPLSTPPSYSKTLYRNLGAFYTLGIPEDTKALSEGYLTFEEYISQARLVLSERLEEFDYTWRNFSEGLYFFYFSTLDQNSHALWSTFDEESPIYNPETEAKYGQVLQGLYGEIDLVLGRVLEEMRKDDLLIIMSDHGFAPFRYGFNLNTWLMEKGYITLKDSSKRNEEFFTGVDWRKTQAYGLGINSLYLNMKGRENGGVVKSGKEAEELKDKLIRELTAVIDPATGEPPVSAVWKREQIYHGSALEKAPDLIIGYNTGYRASWETVLGKFPEKLITPNLDKWAGDHCVDYRLVPGVLLSNRKIALENPALYDLTPTILAEFGIPKPDYMVGKSIF
jgi:predicted AlkP superfamily phosphohydrolase/phosphomutase